MTPLRRARFWLSSSSGSVAAAFRGGRFWRQAQEIHSTDTLACALGFLCLAFLCVFRCLRALGFSSLRHRPDELEGAPPLVSKGGLLPSNVKAPPFSPLGFLSHGSRFTSHESPTPEALP